MTYNPKEYWRNRHDITPHKVPKRVQSYIREKITNKRTILDFGCGNGRLVGLFENKYVFGYDIVYRDPPYPMIDTLAGCYDAIIASKVLLHIPDVREIITTLQKMSDLVIVWDAVGQDAPHVFDHDFSKYGTMKDVQQWDNQILFTYENNR